MNHSAGGTAGNVAANLAWLGGRAAALARIGDDHAGNYLSSDLEAVGVEVGHLYRDSFVNTPLIVHEIRRDGNHRFRYSCPICGRQLPRYRPPRPVDAVNAVGALRPDVFFFDRASSASLRAAALVHEAGGTVMFEPNTLGRPELTAKAAEVAHIIKISSDRIKDIGGVVSRSRSGQLQIVTLGAAGYRWRSGRGRWHGKPALDGVVLDPGGAGDWMTAGFLYHLTIEKAARPAGSIEGALRFGQALATLSCAYVGSRGLASAMSPATAITSAQNVLCAVPESTSSQEERAVVADVSGGKCSGCLGPERSGVVMVGSTLLASASLGR